MLLAETAIKYNAERFLNISTDKAVSPSSVMGASKRLGEMVIRALSGTGSTKMISVRFGNVLGSSGSVVRIFQDQINKGGPVTVTDTRATRYLMTTSEAVQLIMQACAMGGSSLAPEVFRCLFPTKKGFLKVYVIDSTHPDWVTKIEKLIDIKKTLFIFSSKSGGTVEPTSFFRHFYAAVGKHTSNPSEQFMDSFQGRRFHLRHSLH